MEKVTEKTIVQLGKFYLVKCAFIKNDHDASYHIPVIGEMHRDPQFGVDLMHYHIDGRFTDPKKYGHENVDENGRTNHIVFNDPDGFQIKDVVYKKLKCKRLTTGIKIPPPEKSRNYRKWYASMIGKSCKGKKCPHLGFTMQEQNGRLVCPLHNLQADLVTEKIVPFI